MSSTSDKMSGEAKQTLGKMTDDKKLQSKGKAEETRGKVKKTMKDANEIFND